MGAPGQKADVGVVELWTLFASKRAAKLALLLADLGVINL
jgi:hypothetical protein